MYISKFHAVGGAPYQQKGEITTRQEIVNHERDRKEAHPYLDVGRMALEGRG